MPVSSVEGRVLQVQPQHHCRWNLLGPARHVGHPSQVGSRASMQALLFVLQYHAVSAHVASLRVCAIVLSDLAFRPCASRLFAFDRRYRERAQRRLSLHRWSFVLVDHGQPARASRT